jgi:NAD(P)H-dependent FMN reductase
MPDEKLKVLAVVGSLHDASLVRTVLLHVAEKFKGYDCEVDILDFQKEPLPLFNPDTSYTAIYYPDLKARVDRADVLVLATPDYHGSISSALKSFLDHFWHEFAGKLFVTVVASHEKGLTVSDQLRTVARQCYAWTLPYGVSFHEKEDTQGGKVTSDTLLKRLDMCVRDAVVYGKVLAAQRRADIAGTDPGFLARYRKKS